MRKLLLVVGLAGCWTSSKPANKPKPAEGDASTGGATYGGFASLYSTAQLSGSAFSALDDGSMSNDVDAALAQVGANDGSGTSGSGHGGTLGQGAGRSGGTVASGGTGSTTNPPTAGGWGSHSGHGRSAVGGASTPPQVTIGEPSGPSQALDPAIIRRLIRRNLNKIQYCYEQELVAQPGLKGRVNVRFSIGADGKVTQSTGSGMPPVDACVAGVIATIEFPKPTGGGVVMVNYPFIFQEAQPDPVPAAP